jgi:hypothetical protein
VSPRSAGQTEDLWARLARPAAPGGFTDAELAGLPWPAARYLASVVAPGTPLAVSARLRMRGRIKVGRWLPFQAREILAPHSGFLWKARVAGVIVGSDRYADGVGRLEWTLAGIRRLVRADGPDVSRSAAERAGAEALFVPTALLPRFGVAWSASDERHLTAEFDVDGRPMRVECTLDAHGRLVSFVFDRWGDPDRTGTWGVHPCGGLVTGHRTFGGVTVPASGRFGWYPGTDRWADGEFFRYTVTDLTLVGSA